MPFKISDILRETWNAYLSNLGKLTGLSLCTALPFFVFYFLFSGESALLFDENVTHLLMSLSKTSLALIGMGLNTGAAALLVSKAKKGESPQMLNCLNRVLPKTWAILGIVFIQIVFYFVLLFIVMVISFILPETWRWLVLLLMIGVLFFLLWFLVAIIAAEAAVVIEDLGPVQGLKRSIELTRGRVRTIILLLLIISFPIGIVASILDRSMPKETGLLVLALLYLFLWTFMGVLRAVIYLKLREASAIQEEPTT